MISNADVDKLLANTAALFDTVHHFECESSVLSGKSSRAASITYSDLVERRSDFIQELRNSICNWVYSKSKFGALLASEIAARNGDTANAASHILGLARAKFRKGHPQGQFGELLLFNFLEHFFRAPPLLRKMPITTNPAVERHGADAIHVGIGPEGPVIYLGEAKTYESKYKFNTALEEAVDSILKSHASLQEELQQYVYDEYVEPPFQELAVLVKRNQLPYTVELVSVISYEETKLIGAGSEAEIKKNIEAVVGERVKDINLAKFSQVNPHLLSRMHFFLLPFWKLDDVLKEFEA